MRINKYISIFLSIVIALVFVSCSDDEPEPTYNWWVLISVNQYEVGSDANDLKWVKETRHDERYELNRTESYIKEQQALYDGIKTLNGDYVYIYTYSYKKVDYIPITS